jgi:hypothetical protein
MRTSPAVAALRQAFVGSILVVLSLPLLWMFSRAIGLGAPPVGGVLLLGGSAIAAWGAGGFVGATLGGGVGGLRRGNAALVAVLGGLILGAVLCSVVAPFYAQSVLEGVAHDAASDVWRRRDELLTRAREAVATAAQEGTRNPSRSRKAAQDAENLKQQAERLSTQARESAATTATGALTTAKGLALRAAARLSAMTLLVWTLLGPAIAAFLEARRAARY